MQSIPNHHFTCNQFNVDNPSVHFFDARDSPEGFSVDCGVDRGSSFRGLMVSKVARDVVVNTGN
jgi:hypothetical protein